MLIVDGHCDTIQKALDKNINLESETLSFNLKQAQEKVPILQMTAAFVNPSYEYPFQRASNIIQYFEKQIKEYPKNILQVRNKQDILTIQRERKIGLLLTIENGGAIEGNLENINYFYNKGVRIMSITWNEDNLLGSGALTKCDDGLTELGKRYIQSLNQKKMIIDVSHSSERTFWGAMQANEGKIVATHSCCYSLCQDRKSTRLNSSHVEDTWLSRMPSSA